MVKTWIERHTPKLVISLREGYSTKALGRDLVAGMTVAVIALPLAMALGIASIPQNVADELKQTFPWLSPPAMGLYTAVIAGFLISALGGSRVQIGGPTAAFVPIVFAVCATHGYAGLVLATLMAGGILVVMGVLGLGRYIKYIPYPVETGFTAGIAVSIFFGQIRDFLGLSIVDEAGNAMSVPADFLPKLGVLASNLSSISRHSAIVGAATLGGLMLLRRLAPKAPRALIVMAAATAAVTLLGWNTATEVFDGTHVRPLVQTIGSKFGGVPSSLPAPHLPPLSLALAHEMLPSAFTIAMLCAIESLLSAVVADGMTGFRHRSIRNS